MDLVFQNYKLEVELQAQSPLVHFQAEQVGATLRAPEVKSKLDSYIISCLMKIQKLNFDEFKKKNKDLFRDAGNHDALNYKLSIIDTEEPRYVQLGSRNNYMIFYANMGGGNWKGIISNPKITIMCFNKDLQKHICDNIDSFFNVYNFGFMQGKGFGSFSVKEKYKSKLSDDDKKEIADGLKQVSGAKKCYYFEYNAVPNNDWNTMFDDIKLYYGIMKSGFNFRDNYSRSYLFQYMHEKGIDNEKAYMKHEKIAPAVNTHNRNNNNSTVTNPKYVRSLLGVGTGYEFLPEGNRGQKEKIIISYAGDKEIARVPSPIFFKIIQNVVFIVAFRVPEEIYNEKFSFTNKSSNKSCTLETPASSDFDIDDFMAKYKDYYNGDLRKKISFLRNSVQLGEI